MATQERENRRSKNLLRRCLRLNKALLARSLKRIPYSSVTQRTSHSLPTDEFHLKSSTRPFDGLCPYPRSRLTRTTEGSCPGIGLRLVALCPGGEHLLEFDRKERSFEKPMDF